MVRIRTTISYGGRRRLLAVTWNHKMKTWNLQWANPTQHGHSFDPPVESGFPTKRAALERKREIS